MTPAQTIISQHNLNMADLPQEETTGSKVMQPHHHHSSINSSTNSTHRKLLRQRVLRSMIGTISLIVPAQVL